jgi:hypothetical protein
MMFYFQISGCNTILYIQLKYCCGQVEYVKIKVYNNKFLLKTYKINDNKQK